MLPDGEHPISPDDHSLALWDRVSQAEQALILPFLRDNPVAIGAIASALGIAVIASVLDPSISGLIRISPSDPRKYEIKVNSVEVAVRQRFTVAHEIGHFLLHKDAIDAAGITDTILFRSNLSNKKEAEANQLAAFLLLPSNTVKNWALVTHNMLPEESIIDQIAANFRVSALTVGFRFGF
jgi:hypothetical protein